MNRVLQDITIRDKNIFAENVKTFYLLDQADITKEGLHDMSCPNSAPTREHLLNSMTLPCEGGERGVIVFGYGSAGYITLMSFSVFSASCLFASSPWLLVTG